MSIEYRTCIKCELDKPLYAMQYRRIGQTGWSRTCLSCEALAKGYNCKECKTHKPKENYKIMPSGRKLRICDDCRRKPLELRRFRCGTCGLSHPGSFFTIKNRERTKHNGVCKLCVAKQNKTKRKPKTYDGICLVCQVNKPHSEFPYGKGRRKPICVSCAVLRSAPSRTCNICDETKDLDQYGSNGEGGFRLTCKPCVNRVARIKMRRRRARSIGTARSS
jgi:hypothetical protein